ncbi:hypothetical protein B9Z55_027618 [Caenorhabditis nigoni]|uniref:Protein kinase domain-containing protein n=1 Tax=Caenorhabditis nigoni TaxID=1611254 RepID=A0A2G5SFA6_9PELO|nr:hypothetical protein B9Z55_027618 [Caenorhabditis nigoni]
MDRRTVHIRINDWIQGRYLVKERCGVGLMATCFKVEDKKSRNQVMVCKVTRLRDGATQEEFDQEVAALVKVRGSASFPQVSDSFVNLCHRVIVMSYEGEQIEDVLGRNRNLRISNANCLRVSSQLTSALNFLHSTGFLHRDLSLNNILVKRTTDRVVVTLVDLGYASPTTARLKCEMKPQWISWHVSSGKCFAQRDDFVSAMYVVGHLSGFRLHDFVDTDLDEFKKEYHSRPCSFFKEEEKWIGRVLQLVDQMPDEGTKINMNELLLVYASAVDNISPHSPIAWKIKNNQLKLL